MSLSESRIKYDCRDYRMEALPEGVAIETIMGCNLRCPMCAVPNTAGMNGRKVTLMSMDMFERIIDQISDTPRAVMLTIMGEPLLHPRIVDFVSITKKAGHHAALITNGTKLTRERSIALADAGLDHLTMSMDGLTKRTYEKQRIGAEYDVVRGNLEDLLQVNAQRGDPMRIELNYVVTARTAPEKEAFYREFSTRVRKINFLPVTDWGGQLEIPAELGTPDRGRGRQRAVCYALWGTMFISAEGRAMLCCADFRQQTSLSYVTDRPLVDIWRTEIQEHRRKHVNDEFDSRPCRTCHLNAVDVRIPRRVRLGMLRNQKIEELWRTAVPGTLLPAAIKARRDRQDVPIGHIDVPRPAADVSGLVDVQGWALPHRGYEIDRVEVHIDGAIHGRAEWGFPRVDVGEMHPGVGHSFCGFGYVLDSGTLSNGPHTIEVVAFDNASRSSGLGTLSIEVLNNLPAMAAERKGLPSRNLTSA